MENKKIYLASPHMSDEGYEKKYVQSAFDSNWIAPLGPNVDGFEKELCEYVGSSYGAALISGTSAIHMALKACGVTKGDIVLCSSLTFSATCNPIIYLDAKPVFVDSDYKTWNMDPNLLEIALNKYPETKAVLIVHLYGLSADLDRIIDICNRYKVTLIEDAAESLGSKYKGKQTGTFGDYGVFSFNGNKIITTSGGGMLVSSNRERIEKVRFWATQARDEARHYQHSELGYNYRMSNVVAGIGRGQLKVLNRRVDKKQYIYNYYRNAFKEIKDIELMPINDFDFPNCWLTCIQLTGKIRPIDIMIALENENIESRPIWKPMHLQPFFKEFDFIGSDVSENIFLNGVCLPSDTKLNNSDLKRITSIILNLFESGE